MRAHNSVWLEYFGNIEGVVGSSPTVPSMRIAKYLNNDGTYREVEYDENALCIFCNEPVIAASMGGTIVCTWCDNGIDRNTGSLLTWTQLTEHKNNYQRPMDEASQKKIFTWKKIAQNAK